MNKDNENIEFEDLENIKFEDLEEVRPSTKEKILGAVKKTANIALKTIGAITVVGAAVIGGATLLGRKEDDESIPIDLKPDEYAVTDENSKDSSEE